MAISQNFPSVRPSLDLNFAGTKKLDSRITFTRGSVGTYVDATGTIQTAAPHVARFDHDPSTGESLGLLVEEARTNSLTYSQPDVSGWTANEITYQTNAGLAPDGTWTAALLVPSATNTAGHYLAKSTTNAANTWAVSFHAKAAGYNYAGFTLAAQPDAVLVVDLANGTTTAVGSAVSNVTITALTNGWYRITGTVTTNTNRTLRIYPMTGGVWNTSFSGNGTSGIYVWGAQLEVGSFPTSYIPTPATFTSRASSATYYDASGVIQTAGTNVARSAAFFPDSNGVMRSAGLLLEAAATNKKVNSTTLNPSFVFTNTVSPAPTATIVAPDGVSQTVEILTEDTSTNLHSGSLQFSGTYSDWAVSFFVKAAGRTRFKFDPRENGTFREFDLTAGTVDGVVDPSKFEKLPNGWFRVKNMTVSNFRAYSRWRLLDASGNETYTGNGTSGIYLWGLQWEDSATFSSSYIPTTGSQVTRAADVSSSATVTRSADVATLPTTGWMDTSGGTILAEYYRRTPPLNNYVWSLGNGNPRITFNTNGANLELDFSAGVMDITGPILAGRNRTALKFEQGNYAGSVNGGTVATSSLANAWGSIPTSLQLGNGASTPFGGYRLNGPISRLTYWPTRLPNNILQQITR